MNEVRHASEVFQTTDQYYIGKMSFYKLQYCTVYSLCFRPIDYLQF